MLSKLADLNFISETAFSCLFLIESILHEKSDKIA